MHTYPHMTYIKYLTPTCKFHHTPNQISFPMYSQTYRPCLNELESNYTHAITYRLFMHIINSIQMVCDYIIFKHIIQTQGQGLSHYFLTFTHTHTLTLIFPNSIFKDNNGIYRFIHQITIPIILIST